MKWYFWHLEEMEDFCERFKQEIIDKCFTDSKSKKVSSRPFDYVYCWTPRYQEYWEIIHDLVGMCDMLGIMYLEEMKPIMLTRVAILNEPHLIQKRQQFEKNLEDVKNVFKRVQKEIKDRLQVLDKEEKHRLNEALNCYIRGCNYSAVAMSVSAIEFRLVNLMQSVFTDPKLEKYTLGQLIAEYLHNKKKYKNIIPEKHEPLLSLCNTYRIFSVHPKKEKITRAIATSIINMTFTFLLDETLKRKAEA